MDNVDTIDEVDDIVPFKNILNEMYIKDCSRRTRDGLKQRMLRGSSIASKPPYGYKFEEVYDGNVKNIKLVPKEDETTEIVREIFNLYIEGWGMGRIATHLNNKGIEPPSAQVIKKRSKNFRYKGGNVHLFSGVLKCNECGGRCIAYSIKEEYITEIVKNDLKIYVQRMINPKELYELAK